MGPKWSKMKCHSPKLWFLVGFVSGTVCLSPFMVSLFAPVTFCCLMSKTVILKSSLVLRAEELAAVCKLLVHRIVLLRTLPLTAHLAD